MSLLLIYFFLDMVNLSIQCDRKVAKQFGIQSVNFRHQHFDLIIKKKRYWLIYLVRQSARYELFDISIVNLFAQLTEYLFAT